MMKQGEEIKMDRKRKQKPVKLLPPPEPTEPSKVGAKPKPHNPNKEDGVELPIPETVNV